MRNSSNIKKAASVRMAKDCSYRDVGVYVNYWKKENHKDFKYII